MAAEALLRSRIGNTIAEDILRLTQEAEEAKRLETHAAVNIQRSWRGFFVRDGLAKCVWAAHFVQRCWRGYKGRQRAHQQRLVVAAELRRRFFDHCATEIQRCWRGFRSRKYVHSFHARKAYLLGVLRKTEEVRRELARTLEQQAQQLAEAAEQEEVRKFESSLHGKHHLLSTTNCGGVFRARYWQFRSAGDAVELKLRSAEQRGWAQALGVPADVAAAAGVPPPPERRDPQPRYRASIRATEPYNADRERQQLMGGEDFYTAAKPLDLTKTTTSLAAAEPFKPRIREVMPDRSIPARWASTKPQFKTAFPDSKEFDFYDTTMLERPPDPRRTNLVVPGMGMLPRSSQLGVVRSPKGSPLAAALARAGSAVGSAGGSVGGSPVGGGGSRRGQVPVWRTEAGARGGSSRGSAGLGGLGATAPPSQGSRGGGGADGGGAAIRPASGAAGAGAGSVAVGA